MRERLLSRSTAEAGPPVSWEEKTSGEYAVALARIAAGEPPSAVLLQQEAVETPLDGDLLASFLHVTATFYVCTPRKLFQVDILLMHC